MQKISNARGCETSMGTWNWPETCLHSSTNTSISAILFGDRGVIGQNLTWQSDSTRLSIAMYSLNSSVLWCIAPIIDHSVLKHLIRERLLLFFTEIPVYSGAFQRT